MLRFADAAIAQAFERERLALLEFDREHLALSEFDRERLASSEVRFAGTIELLRKQGGVEKLRESQLRELLKEFAALPEAERWCNFFDRKTTSFSKEIAQRLADNVGTLAEMRKLRVYEYDTSKFDFRSLVKDMLQSSTDQIYDLHDLHESSVGKKECEKPAAYHNAFFKLWVKGQGGYFRPDLQEKWRATLHKFVNEVVQKGMFDGLEDCTLVGPVLYQRKANIRVQMPSSTAPGRPHRDSWYHHPCTEINWWVPLTDAWGTNTLHVESEAGLGDLLPLEVKYGQAVRFWGNRCFHKTLPNDTGFTRVSFEVRVVPASLYDPGFTDALGSTGRFKENEYYIRADATSNSVAADGVAVEPEDEEESYSEEDDSVCGLAGSVTALAGPALASTSSKMTSAAPPP